VDIDIKWHQSTTFTNETTGYYADSDNNPSEIGSYVDDNRQYIIPGSLMQYIAPSGYHFSKENKLVQGNITLPGDKLTIWAGIKQVELDGTNFNNGDLDNGIGPVVLNNFIPTEAIPIDIISPYNTNLSSEIEQKIIIEIELNRNFGLGYDQFVGEWYIITHGNMNLDSEFSLEHARSVTNENLDASWLVKFESAQVGFEVTSRSLSYYFASVLETRFYVDNNTKIYDVRQGRVINDFIKILKTNNMPDLHRALPNAITLDIVDQTVEPDGYVNDFNVEVSYTDLDSDNIADDPDFFKNFVAPNRTPWEKNVFFQTTVDFDNLERMLPLASGIINNEYGTLNEIELIKTEYPTGQIFYAYNDAVFVELTVNDSRISTLTKRTDFRAEIGRGDVQFQYRHNSPETKRINPGVSNIIDIYIVTNGYYTAYRNYMQDLTGTVA